MIPLFPSISWRRDRAELASGLGWRVLRLLGLYRLLLGALFFLPTVLVPDANFFGEANPDLFFYAAAIYWGLASVFFVAHRFRKPNYRAQIFIPVTTDLVLLTLLLHAGGGVASGLGILYIVFLAGVAVLVATRMATALAAIGTLLVLGDQAYWVAMNQASLGAFFQAGILGGSFFITAILANFLGLRAGENEALARQREVDLANLAQLNEYIIQRMAAGVVVVDNEKHIRLINEAAWFMMGEPVRAAVKSLDQLSVSLDQQLSQWLRDAEYDTQAFRVPASATVLPRFTRLGTHDEVGVLILLEDTSVMNQQAQTLKLTALGRLTASIAHEIRNPLGAIGHAAQLLEESDQLAKSDRRLVQIIRENSVRTNTIIENVMQLTRRDKANPEEIALKPWLEGFIEEFTRLHQLQRSQVDIDITPADVKVVFDSSHLHQVLFNLCNNALSHGSTASRWKKFELRGGLIRESRGPFLDVIDFGSGIDPDIVAQIFEPFFTTATKGTGLGLYIAKELAEVNRAHLDYIPVPAGGSCFRLTFTQTKR